VSGDTVELSRAVSCEAESRRTSTCPAGDANRFLSGTMSEPVTLSRVGERGPPVRVANQNASQ
jgi:hypothetical protein